MIKGIVYYIRETESRVRTFPSIETMERWLRKFERDFGKDDDENWIEVVITNAETLDIRSRNVRHVRYGE